MSDESSNVGASPTDGDGAGGTDAAQVESYELVLAALLDIRTTEELRDVFARQIVQEAAPNFATALSQTRERQQPDSFALAWAIEGVIAARREADGHDIGEMFDDPTYHTPPSEELEAAFTGMWDERR